MGISFDLKVPYSGCTTRVSKRFWRPSTWLSSFPWLFFFKGLNLGAGKGGQKPTKTNQNQQTRYVVFQHNLFFFRSASWSSFSSEMFLFGYACMCLKKSSKVHGLVVRSPVFFWKIHQTKCKTKTHGLFWMNLMMWLFCSKWDILPYNKCPRRKTRSCCHINYYPILKCEIIPFWYWKNTSTNILKCLQRFTYACW